MTYTPERLAELKAVAEAATPGPWYRKDSEANGPQVNGHKIVLRVFFSAVLIAIG